MSFKLRTRVIPECTTEEVSEVTCDLCGAKVNNPEVDFRSEVNWAYAYQIGKTSIILKEGARYPDSGEEKHTFFHICPKCFKNKLVPWFESQGARISTHMIEW